jgi:long-chain acyl-CoA synthetase
VNRLANALVELGVGRDNVIGLHLPNIPQYVIALGALAKIGCAGSGFSPLLTPGELAYQVRDANISVLISLYDLEGVIRSAGEPLPACLRHLIQTSGDACLGGEMPRRSTLPGLQTYDFHEFIESAADTFEQYPTHWNDTFMIHDTGGTTGKPKGAMLSIRNLTHHPMMSHVYAPLRIGEEVYASAFPMFHKWDWAALPRRR